MIIQNPGYNNWSKTDHDVRTSFIEKINMFDTVSDCSHGSTHIGRITLISEKGVNMSTPWGDTFVKWHHVKEVQKTNRNMKRVYVAHPYGGRDENKDNVEKIVRELSLANPNILYISPIHANGFLYNDVTYEHGMKYCFELLLSCDELLLCEGWENSVGCKMEKVCCEEHNIPIKYYVANK